MRKGRVILVGAGPGDPELITVKGLKALMEADVIVYDRLVPRQLLEYAKPGAQLIYVGKEPGRHRMSQEEINRILVEKALEGKTVVRLKGGDPLIYGRGEEECAYVLSHGIDCTIVPGVPSFVAAAAYTLIPLTSRWGSSSVALVPGREAEEKPRRVDVRRIASAVDTLVILMGAGRAAELFREIASVLGWDTPAAAVMDATMPSQRLLVGTLATLTEEAVKGSIRNPVVIFVGEAVRLRERVCPAGCSS